MNKQLLHPWKLTWNLKIHPWEKDKLLQTTIFGFQPLGFLGGIPLHCWVMVASTQLNPLAVGFQTMSAHQLHFCTCRLMLHVASLELMVYIYRHVNINLGHMYVNTPWKINGWNLQPSPIWKGTWSEPNLHEDMFQPLIFRGVFYTSGIWESCPPICVFVFCCGNKMY